MYIVNKTEIFNSWLKNLKDVKGKIIIARRVERIEMSGNLGDVKSIGDKIFEMRVDCGPGYRIYFLQKEKILIFLLCAGDKSTQARDIQKAKEIAKEFE